MRRSLYDAAPKAAAFMPYPSKSAGFKRVCVRAELRSAEHVGGPVVLGAGRYFGIGLSGPRRKVCAGAPSDGAPATGKRRAATGPSGCRSWRERKTK